MKKLGKIESLESISPCLKLCKKFTKLFVRWESEMKNKINSLLDYAQKNNISKATAKAIVKTIAYLDSPGIHLAEKRKHNVASYNFDWDDNVLFMKTNIWFFHKDKKTAQKNGLPLEIPVSTESFREARQKVGKEDFHLNYKIDDTGIFELADGPIQVNIKDYQILDPDRDKSLACGRNSFKEFGEGDSENFFIKDVLHSLENSLFGPCWKDFVNCLSCKSHAEKMTIITARGHNPQEIYEGLKLLQKQGWIKYLPKVENIYPVSYPGLKSEFVSSADKTSVAKKKVLEKILDDAQKEASHCPQKAPREVGFSDDDHGTIQDIQAHLKPLFKANKWPDVTCVLYFTGNKKKEEIVLNKVA